MWFDRIDSPIGPLTMAADAEGLRYVLFPTNRHAPADRETWIHEPARLADVREQLQEYFAGTRRRFELTLSARGTPFQQRVWSALAQIPFGETWSYADVARRIDAPRAVRAVGAANGRNPLPIVVPCHRVIGANGTLTGFGGGLETKAALLRLESPEGNLTMGTAARMSG